MAAWDTWHAILWKWNNSLDTLPPSYPPYTEINKRKTPLILKAITSDK